MWTTVFFVQRRWFHHHLNPLWMPLKPFHHHVLLKSHRAQAKKQVFTSSVWQTTAKHIEMNLSASLWGTCSYQRTWLERISAMQLLAIRGRSVGHQRADRCSVSDCQLCTAVEWWIKGHKRRKRLILTQHIIWWITSCWGLCQLMRWRVYQWGSRD